MEPDADVLSKLQKLEGALDELKCAGPKMGPAVKATKKATAAYQKYPLINSDLISDWFIGPKTLEQLEQIESGRSLIAKLCGTPKRPSTFQHIEKHHENASEYRLGCIRAAGDRLVAALESTWVKRHPREAVAFRQLLEALPQQSNSRPAHRFQTAHNAVGLEIGASLLFQMEQGKIDKAMKATSRLIALATEIAPLKHDAVAAGKRDPVDAPSPQWEKRSVVARLFGVRPSTVTRWAKDWPELCERPERGSRMNVTALRPKVEARRVSRTRDQEIRERGARAANADARQAAPQLEEG